MSNFDVWYENNATSCDPKTAHLEGRIFVLEWMLKKIGIRNPDGRKGCQSLVDKLKDDIEKALGILKRE